MEVEARVAVRMELQGHQDVEVSGRKATSELKTGWGFMGTKTLSWFGGRYKSRFMRWFGWKKMSELSTGWSFKARKIRKW